MFDGRETRAPVDLCNDAQIIDFCISSLFFFFVCFANFPDCAASLEWKSEHDNIMQSTVAATIYPHGERWLTN